jgi:hypothetical protein
MIKVVLRDQHLGRGDIAIYIHLVVRDTLAGLDY